MPQSKRGHDNGSSDAPGHIASDSTGTTSVHPMELVVQSLIESPLEVLSLNLTSLYESQLILSTILKKLESKLGNTERNLESVDSQANRGSHHNDSEEVDLGAEQNDNANIEQDLDSYLEKVVTVKERLAAVNGKLQKVEKRVDRIMDSLAKE